MITFRAIYEKLFHSFRTMSATNFLDELKSEKIEKVIILQRSWIYGLFVNLLLPIIIVISVIDFSLIRTYEIVTLHPLFLIVGGLFILSSLGLTVTGIAFLRFYRENHRRLYEITETSDIALVRANILMSDRVFSHFFNQIT